MTVCKRVKRMPWLTVTLRVQEGELDRLCSSIGGNATCLSRAAVIASQIDWRYMQRFQKERWLALARRAFDTLDTQNTGSVSVDGMIHALQVRAPLLSYLSQRAALSVALSYHLTCTCGYVAAGARGRPCYKTATVCLPVTILQDKIPADEVQQLYQEVASTMPVCARARNISFQSFMQMLRLPSNDSLDIYDDRHDGSISTLKSQAFGSRSSGGGMLSATPTAHGASSVFGAYLPSSSPSQHASGGLSAFLPSSSPGVGEGSGKARALAASCATNARLEGSRGRLDASGHYGHDLSTVFEQTSI